jgi:ABC-type multidrug transport system ATPase subunit
MEHLDIQSGRVAWLPQKDHFFSMLTVQETLDLAAFLEISDSDEKRYTKVAHVMDALGLTKLSGRQIGEQESGLLHNGLSGGEKRRVSLAVELIASPRVFMGDEPTTGLDSALSEKVVKLIKTLVVEREHIPCLLSLHQPRSSIWKMLDSVILLAPGGRVCYMGTTDHAMEYFARLGFKCPPETNPAEFLLDLVSIDTEDSPQTASLDEARIQRLAVAFREYSDKIGQIPQKAKQLLRASSAMTRAIEENSCGISHTAPFTHNTSFSRLLGRFARLLARSWRQNIRNHQVNAVRLFVSAGNAYFFTNVFPLVKQMHDKKGDVFFTVKSVPDRTALLSFGVINMAMLTVMKTIDLFAKEKPVVLREQQRRQYTSLEYLLSKTLAEIPLDAVFSVIFTTVLKSSCGLRIEWRDLTAVFASMTLCGASLGFAIGACTSTAEMALSVGVPLMVLMLGVGVITPSGVDTGEDVDDIRPSFFVSVLKMISPIAYAIRAVCIAEYQGMQFRDPEDEIRRGILSPFIAMMRKIKAVFRMGGLALVKSGDEILEELGLGNDTYRGELINLAVISFLFLVIAWLGLMFQRGSATKSSGKFQF